MTVNAEIRDTDSGELLPFTTIKVVGKNLGTIANVEGQFVLPTHQLDVESDVVEFSFVGYETLQLDLKDLLTMETVLLQTATINLSEVAVYSKDLTAEDIIEQMVERFPENHPKMVGHQRMFFHRYEKVPFKADSELIMKKSDFDGFGKDVFEEVFALLPDDFIEYQDAVVDYYSNGEKHKILPVQAISLEEGSNEQMLKELEVKMGEFVEDMEESVKDEDIYLKFRTGIFAGKMDEEDWSDEKDSAEIAQEADSLHYYVSTGYVKGGIRFLLRDYGDIGSDNWEFVNKTGKYRYTLERTTIVADELVYEISFQPKRGGLYEGVMYISTSTFGMLNLEFNYAEGKSNENIQLLGIGHSMLNKSGRVIWDHQPEGYFIKYVYAEQDEFASIDRNFSIMRKKKRFMFDKELNEMKFSADMNFNIHGNWELLVMSNQDEIASFDDIEEPKKVKFKKEYAHTPEMWENSTIVAPTSDLSNYKRAN